MSICVEFVYLVAFLLHLSLDLDMKLNVAVGNVKLVSYFATNFKTKKEINVVEFTVPGVVPNSCVS